MWYFYILECRDKSFYTGVSSNLVERLIRHNKGRGSRYTRFRRPVRLVYWEEYRDKMSAFKREKQVKDWKKREKLELIKSVVPSRESEGC